eukprot:764298-Hanusia_phi.AAC.7
MAALAGEGACGHPRTAARNETRSWEELIQGDDEEAGKKGKRALRTRRAWRLCRRGKRTGSAMCTRRRGGCGEYGGWSRS